MLSIVQQWFTSRQSTELPVEEAAGLFIELALNFVLVASYYEVLAWCSRINIDDFRLTYYF